MASVTAVADQVRPQRNRPGRTRRRVRIPLLRLASPVAIVLIWQLASSTGLLPSRLLASPVAVVRAAGELIANGELTSALGISVLRAFLGFLIGAALGGLFGTLAGLTKAGDIGIDPPMQALRTLPHLGMIPLFITWFGVGEAPKIAIVAFGVALPIYLHVYAGIRGVDRKLLEATRVLGFSRAQRLRHVVFPASTEHVMVGLRLAFASAWLSLIVGEQIAADTGIGYLINNARDFLRIDVILVGLAVYAILGLLTDAGVRLIERRVLRWR
ncbi:ABC transporter permease [Sciscionella sediminilitoris]|uniref:ABC transporter permease n=1 Tax=Sciscionella sediminilitoris TaxID=1445613 RepID=UPI0004DF9E42|nr:ABC transporter permease [Sciscionella sp. SE31]